MKKKYPSHKRAGGVAQGVGPEFKPDYKEKKKIMKKFYILFLFTIRILFQPNF
jgi:hypothetical protein